MICYIILNITTIILLYNVSLPLRNLCKLILRQILFFFSISPPKPCKFIYEPLKSNIELDAIIIEIGRLLPQLSDLISQFNNIVTQSGINVITDSQGSMSIDVPNSMPEEAVSEISKRIGIVDRLINTQGSSINDLFSKGRAIEEQLRATDPNYVSRITDQIADFKLVNGTYKH